MSKIALSPNASGTGTFTIAAPDSNTNRTLTLPDAAGELETLQRAGNVLQVLSVTKTDTASFTSVNTNAFVDSPGMSVTITPTSATSKILIMYTAAVSNSSTATVHVRLLRNTTSIGQGVAAGNRFGSSLILRTADTPYALEIGALANTFLDAPNTTSPVTYKLAGTLGATYNGTFYLNRSRGDDNFDYGGRTASSITVMEIAG